MNAVWFFRACITFTQNIKNAYYNLSTYFQGVITQMQSILIFGGDKRQRALLNFLKEKDCEVYISGFDMLGLKDEEIFMPNYIFLPIPYKDKQGYIKAPYSKNDYSLTDIVQKHPQSVYILGRCDNEASDLFKEYNIRYFDLLADEAFLIENAILTAEAAVCAYVKSSDTALFGANCVVTGYGRISKFLCRLLKAYCANVTAAARKDKDIALIRGAGMRAVYIKNIKDVIENADVIFNTVPYHIFLEDELKSISKSTKVIELASSPYGMDLKLAEKFCVNVAVEPSLPGRYFPVSAANAILCAFEREEFK